MAKRRYFTIGEAAKAAETTAETLRHYDRIGLIRPSMRDEWTGYRYYAETDIVRLNTVKALQLMGLPLAEIRKVLEYDSLEKIIGFLEQAEKKADEKIAVLKLNKRKIMAAKADYENKLRWRQENEGVSIKEIPERTILLSDTLEEPALDNLWNYLGHFYAKIPSDLKDGFSFEDIAGIYSECGLTRLFAVCIHHVPLEGLKVLPAGRYLSAMSDEDGREETLHKLLAMAREEYGKIPAFTVQLVIVTGVLQWNYETQVYIGKG